MVKERRERLEENFIISNYINVHTHQYTNKTNLYSTFETQKGFHINVLNRIITLITRKDFRLDHSKPKILRYVLTT